MKKLILSVCFTTISCIASFAQAKKENIKVIYNTDFILDFDKIKSSIPAAYQASFKSEIDRGISVKFVLESNGKMSSFKPEIKIDNNQSNDNSIAQMIIAAEANPQYKDYEKNEFYNVKDFGVKTFLIKDKIFDYQWKITKEKTEIAGYNATKAVGIDEDGKEVIAWYTTSLPYRDGPYRYANLPGLIVKAEMSTDEFKAVFTMKEIEILDKDIVITFPTKGKVVTDKEFMAEMKAMNERHNQVNQGVDK